MEDRIRDILSNVLDSSALIGKDYQAHLVATADGRILTGIIKGEDENAITLATANETVVIPVDEIDERKVSEQSMMPDDLLKPLTEREVRALVAYVSSSGQTPMAATPDNVGSFFNGKDLTGWIGDAKSLSLGLVASQGVVLLAIVPIALALRRRPAT